ncbi:MAG: dTDP-4-dehydrorhamnose reductase [Clostridiales bacterium]|nr:dTDP-4-dehydrorhamnose reductase [Clostridiales bacterium]
MKVLVTGVTGQLGFDVCRRLEELKIEYKGVGHRDFDLTDGDKVTAAVEAYRPDAVIHCAAYTAVDKAETEKDTARAVNVTGTENVAKACRAVDAKLLYISTDYVFDGTGAKEWRPEDRRCPCNYYGLTKARGEDAVQANLGKYFIVRVTWVFGVNGNNIIKTVLRLGREREVLRFVTDQIASPTYTRDLAALLCDMIQTERYGVYHATNEGFCSSYELAKETLAAAGITTCRVEPILTRDYPTPAVRPLNSRLCKEKLTENGFTRLPPWQDALGRFVKELNER